MPTTSDYLTQLQQDRDDLVDNLETKGITGLTGDETFTELVPEVLNIPSGGGDISEYINLNITTNSTGPTSSFTTKNILKLKNLKISNNVTQLGNQFAYLNGLIELSFSQDSNTSNVTNMSGMFQDCGSVTMLDLSMFDTVNVTTMGGMFSGCRNLETADLSSFYTTNVTDMGSMFASCVSLEFLDIRNFTFDSVTSFNNFLGYQGGPTYYVPRDCEIIVKSQTEKNWFATNFSSYTNVKTVAEYEAEQNS